jgi:hypothetical protein
MTKRVRLLTIYERLESERRKSRKAKQKRELAELAAANKAAVKQQRKANKSA